MEFAHFVYIICAVTSMTCAVLLGRAYLRTRLRLLLWSCLCFVGLAINNSLLFVDLVLFPAEISLAMYRTMAAFVGMGLLIYGLIWDSN